MKKNISLAIPREDYLGAAVPATVSEGAHFPTVHLEGYENLDLPESGSITFQYRQKRETTTKEANGKVRYECTLELTALSGVKGKDPAPPAKSGSEAGNALDALMNAKSQETSDEGY